MCLWGQRPPAGKDAPNLQSAKPIHVQSSLVVAPLTVTDAAGNFVENLKQSDFRVLDDGVLQRIARVELAVQPVSAVIVIQANSDMAPLLDQVHPLGPLFSNLLLGQQGEAALITYADRTRVVQQFSSDPETLAASLRSITTQGSEARLNDALVRAISMLATEPMANRRVIVALSEGFDRGSETNGEEVVRAASNANVTIYGLRFSPNEETIKSDKASGLFERLASACPNGPPPVCRFRLNFAPLAALGLQMGSKNLRTDLLRQYVGYTGGVTYTHWKKESLQDQLQSIALEINSQYILTYVPSTLNRVGFHTIQIEVSKPGLRVQARAGYFYGAKVGHSE